jgi:hypothetical protein
MQMRRGNEGQGTARSASKAPGKKQAGEQESPANENTGATPQSNQGAATGAQSTPGAAGNQQGTSRQQAGGGEQDLLTHAKEAGGEIVNKVQERAGSQINRQKETAATEISQVANAVRRIRESLPGEESGAVARFAAEYGDKAADSLERLSKYIREQDPKQLLDDVQNFGRRRPALLLGGAFLLGFAGARLIKSSMDMGSQHSMNMGSQRQSSRPNAL